MDCIELAAMRQEATRCFKEFNQRRRRAREFAARQFGEHLPGGLFLRPSDFEGYLQRRLAKSTAQIEAHIAAHGCQR
jgi:hypothetical protein